MKTKTKALALALCAVLLVVSTVFVTMAYLTSQTDVVTNTFTVGKVTITLDEAKVNVYGNPVDKEGNSVPLNAAPRQTENEYKLIPGHEYTKDPTIHVANDSENCWLFVKIADDIATIQDDDTITTQMTEKGWSLVSGTTNVYAHKDIANAGDEVVVFESFKIKGDVKNDALADCAGKTIKVIAYAVQSDGFNTAADAWAAAPSNWQTPAN